MSIDGKVLFTGNGALYCRDGIVREQRTLYGRPYLFADFVKEAAKAVIEAQAMDLIEQLTPKVEEVKEVGREVVGALEV